VKNMSDRLRYLKRIINQQGNRDVVCLRNDDAQWILDEVERLRAKKTELIDEYSSFVGEVKEFIGDDDFVRFLEKIGVTDP
jgi:hypothetical protein